ncbi:MAG: carbohydrate ABC transporter permease [bacterium]
MGIHNIQWKARRISRMAIRENLTGYLFAAPWLLGFSIFSVYAIFSAIYYSFTDYSVLRPPEWVGLENFISIFTEDKLFGKSLFNTAYYAVFAVPLGIAIALTLAILLNQRVIGLSWFRAIFYIPSVVPIVASSILWLWILNSQFGLLNVFLAMIGIEGPPWLTSPQWSKPSFIIMSTWGVGGTMIIFLAGLQGVPRHLYEAAEIDGAGTWQKFIHVTIPMITPTIFFALVMGIIGAFQTFVQAFIITSGGPADSTLFYVLYLYRNAFQYYKMGYASALALILFLIVLTLTIIIVLTSEKWVYYEMKK